MCSAIQDISIDDPTFHLSSDRLQRFRHSQKSDVFLEDLILTRTLVHSA